MKRLTLEPTERGTRILGRAGLITRAINQIQASVTFEVAVKLNTAMSVGHNTIGAYTFFGPDCDIRNAEVGRFCSIAANVAIGPAEHPTDWLSSHTFQFNGSRFFDPFDDWQHMAGTKPFLSNRKRTTVGNDVWIGRGALIKQGVTVGDGAIIGAGSVVTRDVRPYAVVVGTPAKEIRRRFDDDTVERMLSVQWWNWKLSRAKGELPFDDAKECLSLIEARVASGEYERFTPQTAIVQRRDDRSFLLRPQQEKQNAGTDVAPQPQQAK